MSDEHERDEFSSLVHGHARSSERLCEGPVILADWCVERGFYKIARSIQLTHEYPDLTLPLPPDKPFWLDGLVLVHRGLLVPFGDPVTLFHKKWGSHRDRLVGAILTEPNGGTDARFFRLWWQSRDYLKLASMDSLENLCLLSTGSPDLDTATLGKLASSRVCSNLRVLRLGDCGIFPAMTDLADLPSLPRLEELELEIPPTSQAVPEELFQSALFQGEHLHRVRIRCTHGELDRRMARGWRRNLATPGISELDLMFGHGSRETGLAELACWRPLASLRHLGLVVDRTGPGSWLTGLLGLCQNLNSLALTAGPAGGRDPLRALDHSGVLNRLESFELNGFHISPAMQFALAAAVNSGKLKRLGFKLCRFPAGSGTLLGRMILPSLEALKVEHCAYQSGELDAMLQYGGPVIRELHLGVTATGGMGTGWITGDRWPVLRRLDLRPLPTEEFLPGILAQFPNLEVVNNSLFSALD
jgi:hypothetical protein